jgi:hypothetical protein
MDRLWGGATKKDEEKKTKKRKKEKKLVRLLLTMSFSGNWNLPQRDQSWLALDIETQVHFRLSAVCLIRRGIGKNAWSCKTTAQMGQEW